MALWQKLNPNQLWVTWVKSAFFGQLRNCPYIFPNRFSRCHRGFCFLFFNTPQVEETMVACLSSSVHTRISSNGLYHDEGQLYTSIPAGNGRVVILFTWSPDSRLLCVSLMPQWVSHVSPCSSHSRPGAQSRLGRFLLGFPPHTPWCCPTLLRTNEATTVTSVWDQMPPRISQEIMHRLPIVLAPLP